MKNEELPLCGKMKNFAGTRLRHNSSFFIFNSSFVLFMEYAIIVAGGKGLRMGADLPKQFLPVGGKPVLMRTMEAFYAYSREIRIVLILPHDQQGYWQRLCREHGFILPHSVADGGETRFHSVRNGLRLVESPALVAVHDGVRPFVSPALIRRLFEEADANCNGAIPVVPCVDTIKVLDKTDGGLVRAAGEKADRSRLYAAQTPQIFRSELLKRAYSEAYNPEFTDDASVAESYGMALKYLEGERYNLKITSPDDMKIAEKLF